MNKNNEGYPSGLDRLTALALACEDGTELEILRACLKDKKEAAGIVLFASMRRIVWPKVDEKSFTMAQQEIFQTPGFFVGGLNLTRDANLHKKVVGEFCMDFVKERVAPFNPKVLPESEVRSQRMAWAKKRSEYTHQFEERWNEVEQMARAAIESASAGKAEGPKWESEKKEAAFDAIGTAQVEGQEIMLHEWKPKSAVLSFSWIPCPGTCGLIALQESSGKKSLFALWGYPMDFRAGTARFSDGTAIEVPPPVSFAISTTRAWTQIEAEWGLRVWRTTKVDAVLEGATWLALDKPSDDIYWLPESRLAKDMDSSFRSYRLVTQSKTPNERFTLGPRIL